MAAQSTLIDGMPSPLAIGISSGAAAVLGLAAGGWAYASRWPGSRLFGDALTAPERAGELALTFDDGPNPAWTPKLLDILQSHGVRSTFFLLGGFAQKEHELVRRMVAEGHLIGNHTWSHPDLSSTSANRIREELTHTSEMLQQITGTKVKYFRPPFGARRPAVFRIARELGMTPVLWNAMTSDWSEPSGERIAGRLTQKIDSLTQHGKAANIVLHDGGHRALEANREPSTQAAEQLIARYKGTHRFVTLDTWS
jgi:peptidoglycan/xylan/chitin deacetylase (PgdA/CDA1 family)